MDGRRERSQKQFSDQSQSRPSDESPARTVNALIAVDDKVMLSFAVLHAYHINTKGAVPLLPLGGFSIHTDLK